MNKQPSIRKTPASMKLPTKFSSKSMLQAAHLNNNLVGFSVAEWEASVEASVALELEERQLEQTTTSNKTTSSKQKLTLSPDRRLPLISCRSTLSNHSSKFSSKWLIAVQTQMHRCKSLKSSEISKKSERDFA